MGENNLEGRRLRVKSIFLRNAFSEKRVRTRSQAFQNLLELLLVLNIVHLSQ